MRKLIAILAACLCTGQVTAATYSTICNACDEAGMYDAAARVTSKGTVYVFDATDGDARKFKVETEIISLSPYWAMTWGDPLPIETDVKSAFEKFSTVYQEIDPNETIVLPPDFPISSVAGALIDPGAATVRIVDHIRSLDAYARLEMNLTSLVLSLMKRNIPFFNLSDFLKFTKIIIEFPDGSKLEFELFFSSNAVNATANVELRIVGNARMPDGSPAPTTRYGFRNFSHQDTNHSVMDWVMWAQRNGITVTGAGGDLPTRMECEIIGSEIICRAVAKP